VAELDRDLVRKLAEWSSEGAPVSSLYLDVDGRRYPRKQDYLVRAEELGHRLRSQAHELDRDDRTSVEADAARILDYLRALDRGSTRGVALFSCSRAGLWEDVPAPRPLKDGVAIDDHPHVLPLEVLLDTHQSFCTVLVDREKARIFRARLGRIQEEGDVFDEVPGQHDQGGWSQSRYQRHIGEHVAGHLKHVAEVLLRYLERRGFDHLILAGPQEVVAEFERHLHDYVSRRIVARTSLPVTASAAEVLERSLAVEEEMEKQRERGVIERLFAEAIAGRQAVTGMAPVLDALNDGRVGTLVVPFSWESKGVRCSECGRLAESGGRCRTCGGPTDPVPDVVEAAVAAALKQSASVETVTLAGREALDSAGIGAFLRY
jgi:peptide chain release factor subunit 1